MLLLFALKYHLFNYYLLLLVTGKLCQTASIPGAEFLHSGWLIKKG